MAEFWDMTPRETRMVIEAANWRDERRQEQELIHAWSMATLVRAKRIPSIKQLLTSKPAKPVCGKELEKRRDEFKKMTANVDVNKLAEQIKKSKHD